MDSRRKSFDSDKSVAGHSVASSSSGPVDLTSILANHMKLDHGRIPLRRKKRSSDGAIVEETRNVLLYNGKIPLNLVQQLFDLHFVEMKHGPSWIVLTADGDGFIPVAFKAKQEIIIRDGKDNFDLQQSYAFKANFSS